MIVKVWLKVPAGELQGVKEVTAMKLEEVGETKIIGIDAEYENPEDPAAQVSCCIKAYVCAPLSKKDQVFYLFREEQKAGICKRLVFERAGMQA